MGVPNEAVFAPGVSFGEVRALRESEQLKKLRDRIEHQICNQIRSLGFDLQADGTWKAHGRSPFPFTIMSCIALETLGNVFFREEAGTTEGRDLFCYACGQVDPKWRKPTIKGFAGKLKKRFEHFDFSGSQTIAEILYKTFRNKMAHDYLAGAIYLTGDETSSWDYREGYLILNPSWLGSRVCEVTTVLFNSYQGDEDREKSCKDYLALLLR